MSRSLGTKAGLSTPPSSLPTHRATMATNRQVERDESAIDDEQNDEFDDEDLNFNTSRTRRASEGQSIKGDGKKAHPNDLRCKSCGKGYKHSSCLTKHLFVPTFLSRIPPWSLPLPVAYP
jgi:hypothetical protein